MTWLCKDEDERQFYEELKLNQLSDRVIGLLCGTIVEDRLADAIKVRWRDMRTDGGLLSDRLFSYQGPVGTFGNKIDIGFAIGLYTEQTFKDLHTIRKIRNAFAHNIAPNDFNAQQIKDLAGNIKLPDKYPIKASPGTGPTMLRSATSPTPIQLMETILGHSCVDDVLSARNRFIRAAELLNGLLFVLQAEPYVKKAIPEI
jgi:hypothetical protein